MVADTRIAPALGRQLSSNPFTLGNVACRQNGAAREHGVAFRAAR